MRREEGGKGARMTFSAPTRKSSGKDAVGEIAWRNLAVGREGRWRSGERAKDCRADHPTGQICRRAGERSMPGARSKHFCGPALVIGGGSELLSVGLYAGVRGRRTKSRRESSLPASVMQGREVTGPRKRPTVHDAWAGGKKRLAGRKRRFYS